MTDPSRTRVTGPLVAYVDGFRGELIRQGYTPGSAARQLQLMAHVSRWLVSEGLTAGELTPARAEEFLKARRADGYALELSGRGLMPLLGYLRGLGAVPVRPEPVACTPTAMLVEDYSKYLASERGLAAGAVARYAGVASLFLSERERAGGLDLGRLTAGDVRAFAVGQCRSHRTGSARMLVTGLRSLLRFLLAEGYTTRQLAQAVPTATGWAGGSLPRPLDAGAVAAMLAGCDPVTVVGLRDFAILTVLHRLGLRAGEAAALELGDIDWHHGEIVVRGKGGRQDRLPLPVDVGEALVAYLRRRPRTKCRTLFMKVRAPIAGLTPDGVEDVVRGACMRAGLPPAGAHRLRHSAATAMLAGGASLTEVGQVLRHARLVTTSIYAKVDRTALRTIARPWPGGAQ